jgi:hypothetical protein
MKKAGIEAKQMYNSLLEKNQNNPVILRDIYNQRHIIRRDDLRGKRFIQAFFIALTDLSIQRVYCILREPKRAERRAVDTPHDHAQQA